MYKDRLHIKPTKGETEFGPSQTIPNQTLSMRELYKRYAEGKQLYGREPIYLDAEAVDMINRYYAPGSLDLTDVEALDAHISYLHNEVQEAKIRKQNEENEKTESDRNPQTGIFQSPELETEAGDE